MKKLFLSCAVACAAVTFSITKTFAQDTKPVIGIQAGADLMTLGSSSTDGVGINYKYRVGFQGGLFADIPLSAKVSFAPQVLFTQKGGNVNTKITEDGVTLSLNGSAQANYIDVPLLFAFKPQTNLNLYVGPQVAFFMSQKTTLTATDGTNTETQSETSTDGARKVIVGGNVGIGYNFTKNVGVDLHYIFDFQHINTDGDSGERSSGFALSVKYLF